MANAILLAAFAQQYRREGAGADAAAARGATSRLRPILMTTFAMIAGMIPVAVGAERLAPLEWVDVRRGELDGDAIEVFGDLRVGDDVVRRGNDEVRPGTKITPTAVKG